MNHSIEELLAVARTYWPSSLEASLRPEACPEYHRLQERWRQELAHLDRWHAFLDVLKNDLPGFIVGDATATVDACWRCAVYPREGNASLSDWAVVGCVSILAPVSTLYAVHQGELFSPPPSEMRTISDVLTRRIESTWKVVALSQDITQTPVPLWVDPHRPPSTTLFHALFTSQPKSLP
ncbi:hypothetical protein [Melittangium boletus]|uniref:hypothetical protein n=1 Tax=Melittangium boletus TaxID=83453 RepID=UPI003DA34AE9